MTEEFDFTGLEVENHADTSDILGQISELVKKVVAQDKKIAETELALKKLKDQRKQWVEKDAVDMMEQVNMEKLTTGDGYPIQLKENIFTSISGSKKPGAIKWLDDNGHGGIVSRKVEIEFNIDDEGQERVKELVELIKDKWPNHKVSKDVNAARVKSLVKRLLEDGVDVPKETFGIYHKKEIKIKS